MSIRVNAVILVGALLLADDAFAQENSPTAGGGGGASFTISCEDGRVLIGIKGRTGNYLSRVQGICAELNTIIMPGDTSETSTAGSGGGQEFEQRCPSGFGVRGLRVRSGSYVDAIKIRCGMLGRTGRVEGTVTHPIWNGGGGGQVGNLNCPGDLPGIAIRGRAQDWVDNIGLRCQAATVPAVTAGNQPPDLRVAIRRYPTVVTSNARISYRVELWNVGGAAANNATVNIVTPGSAGAEFSAHPSFSIPVTCNSNAGSGRRCTAGAAIGSGGRMVVVVSMVPQGGGVEVESSAIADEPAQIAESNETNNNASVRLRRVLTQ